MVHAGVGTSGSCEQVLSSCLLCPIRVLQPHSPRGCSVTCLLAGRALRLAGTRPLLCQRKQTLGGTGQASPPGPTPWARLSRAHHAPERSQGVGRAPPQIGAPPACFFFTTITRGGKNDPLSYQGKKSRPGKFSPFTQDTQSQAQGQS